MNIDISILKEKIFPAVYQITGYSGKLGKDIDNLSTTEDDKNILSLYMDEAITNISDVIARKSYLKSEDDTTIVITFNMPANWNINTQTSLSKNLTQYIVNYICYKWFVITKQDTIKSYSDTLESIVLKIRQNLSERNKP
jgi:hypothetical protein